MTGITPFSPTFDDRPQLLLIIVQILVFKGAAVRRMFESFARRESPAQVFIIIPTPRVVTTLSDDLSSY